MILRSRGAEALLLIMAGTLAGCAGSDVIGEADRLATYYHPVGDTRNPIDRALALCPEKLPQRETECVKQGLIDARVGTAELASWVPGCRPGRICTYDHTTQDQLGFIPANASVFVVKWRVSIDLRHPAAGMSGVPITVQNRDDFTVPTPPAPKTPPPPEATPAAP